MPRALLEGDGMMDELLKIIDGGEELTDVIPFAHVDLPDELAAIRLHFSQNIVCVVVNPDDDSLTIGQSTPANTIARPSLKSKEPWSRAIGTQVLWAWHLTNHQGYVDGLQLAFCEPGVGKESVVVQMIGKASTVEVSTVHRS